MDVLKLIDSLKDSVRYQMLVKKHYAEYAERQKERDAEVLSFDSWLPCFNLQWDRIADQHTTNQAAADAVNEGVAMHQGIEAAQLSLLKATAALREAELNRIQNFNPTLAIDVTVTGQQILDAMREKLVAIDMLDDHVPNLAQPRDPFAGLDPAKLRRALLNFQDRCVELGVNSKTQRMWTGRGWVLAGDVEAWLLAQANKAVKADDDLMEATPEMIATAIAERQIKLTCDPEKLAHQRLAICNKSQLKARLRLAEEACRAQCCDGTHCSMDTGHSIEYIQYVKSFLAAGGDDKE